MKKLIISIICCLAIFTQNFAESLNDFTIKITDDGAEWPPYTYFKRINGKKTNKIEGFSVDVISEIFEKNNISYTIELLPWIRAQRMVEIGEYHIFLSGAYSNERAAKYYISVPYYSMTNVAFYSAKKYPNGLTIKGLDDIDQNYKVLGLSGYDYVSTGLDVTKIDQNGIKDFNQLIQMLHNRLARVDMFIEGYELFVGFRAIGDDYLSDNFLKYTKIPGVIPNDYYMMISRNFVYGKELKDLIDNGIKELIDSGRMNELKAKYGLLF